MEIQSIVKYINPANWFAGKEKSAPINDAHARWAGNAITGGYFNPIHIEPFDGEKTPGSVGPAIKYFPDHGTLSARAWQSYLESEITSTIINRFVTWVVGSGLRLQAEPLLKTLNLEGIGVNEDRMKRFQRETDEYWKIYAGSRYADHAKQSNLGVLAGQAMKNALMRGDVLVVLRFRNNRMTVQIIDGDNVVNPMGASRMQIRSGNRIKDGIEINGRGEHIAYHVLTEDPHSGRLRETRRIRARGHSTGIRTAFLVRGMRYRTDDPRGLPIVTACLETLAKLERYKEATVASAEELAKVPYTIEHEVNASGENPMIKKIMRANNTDGANANNIEIDSYSRELEKNIAATTEKDVYNMPPGAKLKALEVSNRQLQFPEFYKTNFELVCGTVGIPPEVAYMKYDSNFSASRAALKDWEHTLRVWRKQFAVEFYKPIYEAWLTLKVASNKINAPGYLQAFGEGNIDALEAYTHARFIGENVPHIDPVKEVEAERKKLGSRSDHIPLTTVEKATENLNEGDSHDNIKKFGEEHREAANSGVLDRIKHNEDHVRPGDKPRSNPPNNK